MTQQNDQEPVAAHGCAGEDEELTVAGIAEEFARRFDQVPARREPVQVLQPDIWGELLVLSATGDRERCRIVGRLARESRDVSFHPLAQGPIGMLRALLNDRHYVRREGSIRGDQSTGLEIHGRRNSR